MKHNKHTKKDLRPELKVSNEYVTKYLDDYYAGRIILNQERIDLIHYLEKSVLSDEDLFFNEQQLNDCINFIEKWYFHLQTFQKFLLAFVFLYHHDNTNYYGDFLWLMGRGSGKNGLISGLSNYLISELYGTRNYNGSIVANSEDQAKTSIEEIYNTVHLGGNERLIDSFYSTNSRTKSRLTNSVVRYRTSNGNTKDGLRDGFVIFDEIHEYQDDTNVKVHLSGLGKVPNPRVFYIGSDGYVREGFLDKKIKLAKDILAGKVRSDRMFPWICKLNSENEIDDPDNWEMAIPMLSKPLTGYGKTLLRQVRKDYDDLEDTPSGREEFLTKRMDLPSQAMERSVAEWDEIMSTNKPFPESVDGYQAIAAVDYASIRDFIAAAVTIKHEGKIITFEKQWARKAFCDKFFGYSRPPGQPTPNKRLSVPIKDWEERGLLEVVDAPILDPQLPLNWIREMAMRFSIKKVVMDNYRAVIMRKLFEDAGFEVDIIKNPTAIDGLLAPIIDNGFARRQFIWGDNPLLRWNTQNVLVKVDGKGNKQYLKKEENRRKTDGFKAFEYTLYRIDDIEETNINGFLDMINNINF